MLMFLSRRRHGGVVPPSSERTDATREDARIHDARCEAPAALPPTASSPNITEPFSVSIRRKQRTKPLIAYLCRRFSPAFRRVRKASSSSTELLARQASSSFAFVPVGSFDPRAPTPSPAFHHPLSSPTSSQSRSKSIDSQALLVYGSHSQVGTQSVILQSRIQRDSSSEASSTLSEALRDRELPSQPDDTTDSSLEELQGLLDLRTWPQPLHVRHQKRLDYSNQDSTEHVYRDLLPMMAYQHHDVSPISSPGLQTLNSSRQLPNANGIDEDDGYRPVSPLSLDGENDQNHASDTIYSIVDKYDDEVPSSASVNEHVTGVEQPTPSTRILFSSNDHTAEGLPQLPSTWSRNSLVHGKPSARQLDYSMPTSSSESEAEWQTVHSTERNSEDTDSLPPLPYPVLPSPLLPSSYDYQSASILQAVGVSSTVPPRGKGKGRVSNRELSGEDNAGSCDGTLSEYPQQTQLFKPIRAIGNGLVRSPSLLNKQVTTRPTGKTYIRTTSHNIPSPELDLEKGLVQHAAPMGARPPPTPQYGSHDRDYRVGRSLARSSRPVPPSRARQFSEHDTEVFDHIPYPSRCHPTTFLKTPTKPISRRGNTYFDMYGSFPSLGSIRSAYHTDTGPTVEAPYSSDAVPEESSQGIELQPMPQPPAIPSTTSSLVCEPNLSPRSNPDRAVIEQNQIWSDEAARRHHSFYYGSGNIFYVNRNDGTGYQRTAQLYLPAAQAPPLPDGSEDQRHAEKVVWFICILCCFLGPFLLGFWYGCYNIPMKRCINGYAVPTKQQRKVATYALWAWVFVLACAITAAAIGLVRLNA